MKRYKVVYEGHIFEGDCDGLNVRFAERYDDVSWMLNAYDSVEIIDTYIEIRNLREKTPLFRGFCEINGLKDGDYYSAVDYLDFCDSLTWGKAVEIIRKYNPDYHMDGYFL